MVANEAILDFQSECFIVNDFSYFDLQVVTILPTKFQVNWPFGSWEEVQIYLKPKVTCHFLLMNNIIIIILFLLRFVYNKKFTCFPQLVSTEFKRDHSCKWFQSWVTCLFTKNSIFTFSHKFKSRTWFSKQNLKGQYLSIKFPAKQFFSSTSLINGNYSNLFHVEIISLALKIIVNFRCS